MRKGSKMKIIISLVVFLIIASGFSLFVFADTDGYDPDKEYRCPGVCKIQKIFEIDNN